MERIVSMCRLFLCINHLHHGLSDGLEHILVDIIHIIGERVPGGSEGALLAGGIVGDDVDTGDFGCLVYGNKEPYPACLAARHTFFTMAGAYCIDMPSR